MRSSTTKSRHGKSNPSLKRHGDAVQAESAGPAASPNQTPALASGPRPHIKLSDQGTLLPKARAADGRSGTRSGPDALAADSLPARQSPPRFVRGSASCSSWHACWRANDHKRSGEKDAEPSWDSTPTFPLATCVSSDATRSYQAFRARACCKTARSADLPLWELLAGILTGIDGQQPSSPPREVTASDQPPATLWPGCESRRCDDRCAPAACHRRWRASPGTCRLRPASSRAPPRSLGRPW